MTDAKSHSVKPLRTIRLPGEQIGALLDRLDAASALGARVKPVHPFATTDHPPDRYRYRADVGIVVLQPGDSTAASYRVATRTLSADELAFLHGGFIYAKAVCAIKLITAHGAWQDVTGKVVACEYIEANIHEVTIRFDHSIDPALYVAAAEDRRALLAEDSPPMARLAQFFLQEMNVKVDHVDNGRKAVEMGLKRNYDFILMDMRMPEMDGYEAVAALRKKGYTGKIIAVTACSKPADRTRCLDVGCDLFMPKPYTERDLAELLKFIREEPIFSTYVHKYSMSDLINRFVAELPAKVRAIQESVITDEFARLEALVLELKGAGTGYGFPPVSEAAAKVDVALGDGAPRETVLGEVDRLIRICLRVKPNPQ